MANTTLRAPWQSGECPSAQRLCSSSFRTVKLSFLFFLTLPSFATTFKSSASSEIKTMLTEAFVNNGVGKMLRHSICLSAICISKMKTALYICSWKWDLRPVFLESRPPVWKYNIDTSRGQSIAGRCWSGDAFTYRLLVWIWPVQ